MSCWQTRAMGSSLLVAPGEGQPLLARHGGSTWPPEHLCGCWLCFSPSAAEHPCKADFASLSSRTGCWGSLLSDKMHQSSEAASGTSAVSLSSIRQRKPGEMWSLLVHATAFYSVQTQKKKLRSTCWPQLLFAMLLSWQALGWEKPRWAGLSCVVLDGQPLQPPIPNGWLVICCQYFCNASASASAPAAPWLHLTCAHGYGWAVGWDYEVWQWMRPSIRLMGTAKRLTRMSSPVFICPSIRAIPSMTWIAFFRKKNPSGCSIQCSHGATLDVPQVTDFVLTWVSPR